MPTHDQVDDLLTRLAATPHAIATLFANHSDAEIVAAHEG